MHQQYRKLRVTYRRTSYCVMFSNKHAKRSPRWSIQRRQSIDHKRRRLAAKFNTCAMVLTSPAILTTTKHHHCQPLIGAFRGQGVQSAQCSKRCFPQHLTRRHCCPIAAHHAIRPHGATAILGLAWRATATRYAGPSLVGVDAPTTQAAGSFAQCSTAASSIASVACRHRDYIGLCCAAVTASQARPGPHTLHGREITAMAAMKTSLPVQQ